MADSVLAVQPGQPALLRLAAFAHAMKGDSAAAAAAGESIHKLYPESIGELGGEAESEATKLVDSGAFAEAVAMANLAMALDLSRKSALAIRGTAELAQANFAAAAKTFADQFDPESSGVDWLRAYAIAVAAARPQSALAELQSLLANRETSRISDGALRVERAGLALMGGSNAEALDVVQRVNDGSIAPELLARLGWWSLQAHRPDTAAAVLDAARKLRPGDSDVQNALAWLSLEMGKPAGAIAATESQSADPLRQNGRDVRETLAAWQQGRASDAIRDWTQAVRNKPQWLNPAWRAAIYPPRIAAPAAAIEAERQRRAAMKEPARSAAR